MATILQSGQIYTTMEELHMISEYESNSIIIDEEPCFKIGKTIEIVAEGSGQSALLPRIVKDIRAEESGKWLITFNGRETE